MIERYFIKAKRKENRKFRMKLSTRIVLFIHKHIKPLKDKTLARFDIFINL